jgi:hypothetical protein
MKKFILLALALFSMSSMAQSVLWPEGLPCVRVGGLTEKGTYEEGVTQYAWFGRTFKEIEAYVAELQGKPAEQTKLSFNYLQYRFGYRVLSVAEYSADCLNFPGEDAELQEIRKKSETRSLTPADFKGPRWLHVVQAIDKEEVNCLAISKINGKLQGCNDIWQGGLQEDEIVCYKGRNYPKCHIDCIQKIYNRQLDLTPGSCPVGE